MPYLTIKCDVANGNAELRLSDEFMVLEPVLKADLLQDVFYDVRNAYDKALRDINKPVADRLGHGVE